MEERRAVKRDEKTLSFEERMKNKSQAGYDHFNNRDKLSERKEAQEKHNTTKGKVTNKKQPRERYSKLPVSTIKREGHKEKVTNGYVRGEWVGHHDFARDPRFQNSSGNLNQGLFAKSYGFIKDYQDERFTTLKDSLKEATKMGDVEQIGQIKEMLAEEKQFAVKQR